MNKSNWGKVVIVAVMILFFMSSLSPAKMIHAGINEADVKNVETNSFLYTVKFSIDDLVFDTLMGYDFVVLKDGTCINEIGKPMLPAKQIKIALPAGMEAINIHVVNIEREEIPGTYNIFPAQPPMKTGDSDKEISLVEPEVETYTSSKLYPSEDVKLVGHTDLAGQGIAIIQLHPLQYIPTEKKLMFSTSITFTIECVDGYECGDYLPGSILEDDRKAYETTIKEMVINPEDVKLQTDPRGTPSSLDLPSGGPYDHVIICRSADVSYWQTLADWHTKRGLKDVIVTVSYIYGNYGGSDDQERIRNFVIDARSTWGTMYFLLCGEDGDLPFKYRTYNGDSIPSDQYYGDYDDDWTYEVYVGRSTARGYTEVNRFIAKVLKYEKDPPLTNYILDITLLGMDLTLASEPPYYTLTRGEYLKEAIDGYIPSRFAVTKVYDTDSTPPNHDVKFLNALDDGQNLVNHNDHCNDWIMGTGDRNHGWYISGSDVDALVNNNRLSNIYSLGCWPNAMDDPNGYDCIAEHFVVYNSLQAGVSFTGNTRSGWFYVGYPENFLSCGLDRYWWRAIFSYGKVKLGEALARTKLDNPHSSDTEKYCHWTLNLLGEPEMSLWTNTPETFDVTHPSTLPTRSSSFLVHVEEVGGGNVENAYVCLWKDDEVYERGYTNSNGDVTLNPSPSTEGDMYVTVTKHNYLPYEGDATVYQAEYTLTTYTIGNGHVDKYPDQATYPPDTEVELTAVADPGWTFDHWSGDLTGSDNPDTIVMDSNKVVTATFTELTIVSILPSIQVVGKGETFDVSVYVEPGERITGITIGKLSFDATLIHANSVTLEGFFDPYDTTFSNGTINNINGEITNVYDITSPRNNVSTDGYFCNISFTAQQNDGISPLDLEDVIIANETGVEAPIEINNGSVTVIDADTIPPEITDVTLTTSDPLDTIIGWEKFTCTVTDNDEVGEVKLVLTGDTTTEYPMNKDGDNYFCNITISTADEYTYHIWANDTIRNYNTSIPQPFDLPLNEDVDVSGKVHFIDLVAVAKAYHDEGPNGWIREDIDNNGKVHFTDLIAIARQYNEEW